MHTPLVASMILLVVVSACGGRDATSPASASPARAEPARAPTPTPAPPAEPMAPGSTTGVASCDAYFAALQRCIAVMPEDERPAVQVASNKAFAAWKKLAAADDSAKADLDLGCISLRSAAKRDGANTCPDVVWE